MFILLLKTKGAGCSIVRRMYPANICPMDGVSVTLMGITSDGASSWCNDGMDWHANMITLFFSD